VVVERAVRPVRAGMARRRRMREELLAHLTAIFEEELQRLGDEQAALDQAAERFGDPKELSEQLDAGVPAWHRLRHHTEQFRLRPGESPMRFVRKCVLFSFVAYPAVLLMALPLWLIRGRAGEFGLLLRIFGVLCVISFGMSLAMEFLTVGMRQALRPAECGGSRKRLGLYSLLTVLFFPALAFVFYWGITGDLAGSLAHMRFTWLFAPAAPLLFILLARHTSPDQRSEDQWAELRIEG